MFDTFIRQTRIPSRVEILKLGSIKLEEFPQSVVIDLLTVADVQASQLWILDGF